MSTSPHIRMDDKRLPVARPLVARPLPLPAPPRGRNEGLRIAAPLDTPKSKTWSFRAFLGPITSAVFHATLLVVLALLVIADGAARGVTMWLDQAPAEEALSMITLDSPLPPDVPLDQVAAELAPNAPPADTTSVLPADAAPLELAALDLTTMAKGAADPGPDIAGLWQDLESLQPRRTVTPNKPSPKLPTEYLAGLKLPDNAVKAGVFHVFAEPPQPVEGQPYWLIIQLQVPDHVSLRKFNQSDVSGTLEGSDGFRMNVPNEQLALFVLGQVVPLPPPVYSLKDRQARWATFVLGAKLGVKDQIRIRSQALNDQQTLEFQFVQKPVAEN